MAFLKQEYHPESMLSGMEALAANQHMGMPLNSMTVPNRLSNSTAEALLEELQIAANTRFGNHSDMVADARHGASMPLWNLPNSGGPSGADVEEALRLYTNLHNVAPPSRRMLPYLMDNGMTLGPVQPLSLNASEQMKLEEPHLRVKPHPLPKMPGTDNNGSSNPAGSAGSFGGKHMSAPTSPSNDSSGDADEQGAGAAFQPDRKNGKSAAKKPTGPTGKRVKLTAQQRAAQKRDSNREAQRRFRDKQKSTLNDMENIYTNAQQEITSLQMANRLASQHYDALLQDFQRLQQQYLQLQLEAQSRMMMQ